MGDATTTFGISGTSDPPAFAAAAAWLDRQLADLADRMAVLLSGFASDAAQPQVDSAQVFLREHAATLRADDAANGGSPGGGNPVVDRLVDAWGLDDLDRSLLQLACLPDSHEGFASILRLLHPRGEPWATVGLAAQLLAEPGSEGRRRLEHAISGGPLVEARLVEVQGSGPWSERCLVPAEGLWLALRGLPGLPGELSPLEAPPPTSGLEDWLASADCRFLVDLIRRNERCAIVVTAEPPSVAVQRGATLVAAAGRGALQVPSAASEPTIRLASLHGVARGDVPVVAELDIHEDPSHRPPPTLAVLAAHPGTVLVCAGERSSSAPPGRPAVHLRLPPARFEERRRAWAALLPEDVVLADELAARVRVDPAVMDGLAQDARLAAAWADRPLVVRDVVDALRLRAGTALPAAVKVVRPAVKLDDLVLLDDRRHLLHDAVQRIHHQRTVFDDWRVQYGRPGTRGLRLLFTGPPGTGKTLASEALAGELGVDLLIVDVSRVVSKWIGETEKLLDGVFEAAEQLQAVLLFDEADAIFGERTDVRDANDRYANLETAFLLTRIERFEGLVVLSTNLRRNIDAAFIRRLEIMVDFDMPGDPQRYELWRRHLPLPVLEASDEVMSTLAHFYPISGGQIRNAAISAAFAAAANGGRITSRHLVGSVSREYHKVGRAFPGVPPQLGQEDT